MWKVKKPNGKYKFSQKYYDPHFGKDRIVSITMPNKTNKSERLAKEILEKKISERTQVNTDVVLFRELGDMWFEIYKQNVKQSTSNNVKSRMNRIMRNLGHLRSNQIEPTNVNKFLLRLLQVDNLKYSVVSNDKSIVIRILVFGMQYGYVPERNYRDLITIPPINKSKKDDLKYLEMDELQSVIEQLYALNQHETARMVKIQAFTGMRFNEMVALDYKKDIDLKAKTINITKNYDHHNQVFTTPKTGEARTIHISDKTAEVIKEQINYDKLKMVKYSLDRKNTLLFRLRNENPVHIRSVNRTLKDVKIEGKNLTTHIFRHTFVTLMIQNGTKPRLVAEHVGHNSTKMVEKVYSHFTNQMEEELKHAVEQLSIM